METKTEIFTAINKGNAKLIGSFRPSKGALQVDKWQIKKDIFVITSFDKQWDYKKEKSNYSQKERVEKIIEIN